MSSAVAMKLERDIARKATIGSTVNPITVTGMRVFVRR